MIKKVLMTLSVTALAGSLAWAGEDSSLIVEGQEIKIRAQANELANAVTDSFISTFLIIPPSPV